MHAYVQGPGVELSAFDPVASEFHEDLDDAHDDIVDAHMYNAYDDYSYAWPAADAYASINAPSIGKRCGLRNTIAANNNKLTKIYLHFLPILNYRHCVFAECVVKARRYT